MLNRVFASKKFLLVVFAFILYYYFTLISLIFHFFISIVRTLPTVQYTLVHLKHGSTETTPGTYGST